MILSTVEIARALQDKRFLIEGLNNSTDPTKAPVNTSAIDLRLGTDLIIPKSQDPVQLDLHKGGIAAFLHRNSERRQMLPDQPYSFKRNVFVVANTCEMVDFPLSGSPDSTAMRHVSKAKAYWRAAVCWCTLLHPLSTSPFVDPSRWKLLISARSIFCLRPACQFAS